LKLPVIGSSTV